MERLLVIPILAVAALVVAQGAIQIYFARREMKKSTTAKILSAVIFAAVIVLIRSVEVLRLELILLAAYVFCQSMVIFYIEGKLHGQGVNVVKRDLPKVILGILIMVVVIWFIERLLA